jgi:hypothetical protein
MLALSLVAVSGAAPAMSECQKDCEKQYKYCTTAGKMSEKSCRAEYEKCRKKCTKTEGSPSPG